MIPGIVAIVTKIKAFIDSFDRADSTVISTSAARWQELRGDWSISSNRLSTASAASTHPMAVVNSGVRDVARVQIGQGSSGFGWGVSFWAIDENNWYVAVVDQTTSVTSLGIGCWSGGTLTNGECRSCPEGGAVFGGQCYYNCGCCYQGCGCGPGQLSGYVSPEGVQDCFYGSTFLYNAYEAFQTNYLNKIVLKRSVASTVATIATSSNVSTTSSTARPSYVRVVTSGENIVATAPMSNGSGTITLNHTATGANRGKRHGVALSSVTAAQGSNVDNFEYQPGV